MHPVRWRDPVVKKKDASPCVYVCVCACDPLEDPPCAATFFIVDVFAPTHVTPALASVAY